MPQNIGKRSFLKEECRNEFVWQIKKVVGLEERISKQQMIANDYKMNYDKKKGDR